MSKLTDLVLHSYERRARLTPGLFVTAPIVVTLLSLGLLKNPLVTAAFSVISAGVGAYLLSVVVANLGRSTQDRLWESWGGPPTTQLLRLREDISSEDQRKIWRASIQSLTGVHFLSGKKEIADPSRADGLITAAVAQVRYLGQDERYPLVAAENAQYGLERNVYGARWIGRTLSVVGTASLGLIVGVRYPDTTATPIVGLGLNAALSVAWFIIPSTKRTRDAAFRYGNQLLQAVVREERSTSKPEGEYFT